MNRLVLSFLVLCAAGPDAAWHGPWLPTSPNAQGDADSTERERVVHALNRLGYGPRPGDIERVLAIGLDRYIEQQLTPHEIESGALDRALQEFDILDLSQAQLIAVWDGERKLRRKLREAQAEDSTGEAAAELRRALQEARNGSRQLSRQTQQLAIVRAAMSERQLYEVLVDFWTNHFNVFQAKARFLIHSHIEEVIRPHAMGLFADLLIATAQSPAMLTYLDNAQSVTPGSRPPELERAARRLAMSRARPGGRALVSTETHNPRERLRRLEERLPKGLNENYARELLELHTLGVDGGYTQDDVIAVARILTGWGVRIAAGEFAYNEWAHDREEKTVMGHRFPPNRGMEEGIELLRMLASHPSTMRHVSYKLCERFVADAPPRACVEAGVRAWEGTEGDMTAVVRAIVTSPTFWAEQHRGTKTKTPLEFVVSAVRVLSATPSEHPSLAAVLARLGQPLYLQPAPTGYPETQEAWMSAGALLDRVNVALGFASGRIQGVNVSLDRIGTPTQDTRALVEHVNQMVLHGSAEPNTLDVMHKQAATASTPAQVQALVIGLALGSPEFQRQ